MCNFIIKINCRTRTSNKNNNIKILHNNITLTTQRRLLGLGVPFVTLPVKVQP